MERGPERPRLTELVFAGSKKIGEDERMKRVAVALTVLVILLSTVGTALAEHGTILPWGTNAQSAAPWSGQ